MRFRPKFVWLQALVWIMMSLEGAARLDTYFRRGGELRLVMGLTQMLLGLLCIYLYAFSWWVVDDSGLIERRAWTTRVIPWSEIVRIAAWQPGSNPHTDWIEISYARLGPFSDRGSMKLQPSDRSGLLHALRSHAPQADFDGLAIES
jgi:hypothetical protein